MENKEEIEGKEKLKLDCIYNLDCLEGVKQIKDNTIDAIIIDPPYGIEKQGVNNDDSLKVYYDVLPELYRVLKEDKWFVTFCSIEKLPLMFIGNPFSYVWAGCIYYPNMQKLKRCRIGLSKYSLYLVFEKGRAVHNRKIRDILSHTMGKFEFTGHPSPKPSKCIRKLVECFSRENDIVLDCFMGSGTTGIACAQLNRHFIGFEVNQTYCNIANKRLNNIPISLDSFHGMNGDVDEEEKKINRR